jgi:hypothetical protein
MGQTNKYLIQSQIFLLLIFYVFFIDFLFFKKNFIHIPFLVLTGGGLVECN